MIDLNILNKIKTGAEKDFLNKYKKSSGIGSIGSFGDIKFNVSDGDTLTPTSISLGIGNEVTKNKNIRTPSFVEFQNRKLRTVSLPITLIRGQCDIDLTINTLTTMTEKGLYSDLIIAKKKIGKEPFYITSFKINYSMTDGAGNALISKITLELEEYLEELNREGEVKNSISSKENGVTQTVINNLNTNLIKTIEGSRIW